MFDVTTTSPLDDRWEETDKLLYAAAGRPSDTNEASIKARTHVWRVPTFKEADRLRKKLGRVRGVRATLNETVSGG